MQSLTSHYHQLLGLSSNWKVENVHVSMSGKRVACPVCGASCSLYDHATEQRWRHLDTMQFETILVACLPRCQ
ncbi:transposase family protein, partial [Chlorobaculum thiosulfatiphilum]